MLQKGKGSTALHRSQGTENKYVGRSSEFKILQIIYHLQFPCLVIITSIQ